jgi:RNA polymerase sigma factor (TIGR02999 family)
MVVFGSTPESEGRMTPSSSQDVTQLLLAWSKGDQAALEELSILVQEELHRLAHGYLRQERPDHTLQPTALINEVYLRLIDWNNSGWQNRAHFIGVAAQLMRRTLVDHARSHRNLKRGGNVVKVSLDEGVIATSVRDSDLVAVDEALQRLAVVDPRKSQVVEMHFFGGFSLEETGEALNISSRTVRREWSLAQAWLYRELGGAEQHDS